MEDFNFKSNSFDLPLPGNQGYVSVHVEMKPDEDYVSPTGRYFVYMLDTKHGSCHFIVEVSEEGDWKAEHKPPFVTSDMVEMIGREIEIHDA